MITFKVYSLNAIFVFLINCIPRLMKLIRREIGTYLVLVSLNFIQQIKDLNTISPS